MSVRRKYVAIDWELAARRTSFVMEMNFCDACDAAYATDAHEIARGAHRHVAVKDRKAWLALCRDCHEEMGNYKKWPLTHQYALKAINDPDHYDRVALNRMRGRDDNAINEIEVITAVIQIIRSRKP